MYEFTKIKRRDPTLRHIDDRVEDFGEINIVYKKEEAIRQASRCIQCGNPYCSAIGCPLENYIPQWLKYLGEDKNKWAFKISNETSPFPEILGRICPQGRLCEGACTLNEGHGAVSIGSIEVAITENGFKEGFTIEYPPLGQHKVAIVGSGPAGLSCAHFLLLAGIKPIIFEKENKLGGLLSYGIPHFKLNKETVGRRIEMLVKAGMEYHLNTEIGKGQDLKTLEETHDAVFLATGAIEGKTLDNNTYNHSNLFLAMPFLTNVQKKMYGLTHDAKYSVRDKKIIVIGGGDTAMDCVRTCIREKAAKVKCYYRRDEKNMPGSEKEVTAAKEEGVKFNFLVSPTNLVVDENDSIIGVRFVRNRLIKQENGRDLIEEIPDEMFTVTADIIILALGFNNQKNEYLSKHNILLNKWGGIEVNEYNQTSNPNIYAGGDSTRGADLAVTAALDGRTAAKHIIQTLGSKE